MRGGGSAIIGLGVIGKKTQDAKRRPRFETTHPHRRRLRPQPGDQRRHRARPPRRLPHPGQPHGQRSPPSTKPCASRGAIPRSASACISRSAPVAPPSVSALTDAARQSSRVARARRTALFLRSQRSPAPLRAEIRAQFERFRALGFAPTLLGRPRPSASPSRRSSASRCPSPPSTAFASRASSANPARPPCCPRFSARSAAPRIPLLEKHGVGFADRVFGLRDTGRMTTDGIAALVGKPARRLSELYFHPGAEPDEPDYRRARRAARRATASRSRTPPPPAAR